MRSETMKSVFICAFAFVVVHAAPGSRSQEHFIYELEVPEDEVIESKPTNLDKENTPLYVDKTHDMLKGGVVFDQDNESLIDIDEFQDELLDSVSINTDIENSKTDVDDLKDSLENREDIMPEENGKSENGTTRCCPNQFVEFEGSCYYFETVETMAFRWAKIFCSEMQSNMVVVETKEESDFMLHMMSLFRVTEAWIGLSNTEGTWHWVTGKPLKFNIWGSGRPSSSRLPNCATAYKYSSTEYWSDVPCIQNNFPICEFTRV